MGAVSGDINSLAMKCVDAADLSSRPVNAMKSGDRAYVVSEEGTFWGPKYVLSQDSVLAPDGTTVIPTLTAVSTSPIGPGRWLAEKFFDTPVIDATTAVNKTGQADVYVVANVANVGVLAAHETFYNCANADSQVAAFVAGGPLFITAQLGHPRTLKVNYVGGFDGGTITVSGRDAVGTPITEAFPIPGGGTGVVVGDKAFAEVVAVSPVLAGTVGSVEIQVGDSIGIALLSLGAGDFLKVSVDGAPVAYTQSQPERTFAPTVADFADKTVEVWYFYDLPQTAHTHSSGDAGHTHAQDPHTHTTS